jgi:uncharacterized protein (UPF0333 family)
MNQEIRQMKSWVENLTPEKRREFVRNVMGPKVRILEGDEREHVVTLSTLCDAQSVSNNQSSITESYRIGDRHYDITYIDDQVVVSEVLDSEAD